MPPETGQAGEDYAGYMAAMLTDISKTTGIVFEYVLEEDVSQSILFDHLFNNK